jgi:hypothetical protein
MVRGFFDNGGKRAYLAGTVDALAGVDEIDLICPEPGDNDAAIAQCERRADRIAVLSLPAGLAGVDQVLAARGRRADAARRPCGRRIRERHERSAGPRRRPARALALRS